MSKRRAAGGSGPGSSWMLLAGAAVLLALGAVVWLLLDDPPGAPAEGAPGSVVPVAEPSSEALPMVVPDGVESEVSAIEVEPERTGARSLAAAAGSSGARRQVSGRLLRFADRSPITDAQLSADGSAQVRTGSKDGSFALAVAEGDLDLQLTLGERRAVVQLPSATGDLEQLELVVDTGWILPGVVRSVGGEPIPGARVESQGSSAVGDAAGRFRLLDVRPSAGSPAVAVRAFAPMYVSREVTVALPAGQRVAPPVLLRLRGAGALEGWVHAPAGAEQSAGRPVRILLRAVGGNVELASQELEARTEEDGHYRIDGISPGRSFVAVESTPEEARRNFLDQLGYIDESGRTAAVDDFGAPGLWVPDVVIRENEVTRLDLTLLAGGTVSGRVTDAAGLPLPGARVVAVREQVWEGVRGRGKREWGRGGLTATVGKQRPGEVLLESQVGSAVADSNGGFVLTKLPAGTIVLRAEDDQHPGWRAAGRTVQVVSGVRSTGVDLRLGEGLRVIGQVFDAQGQPAAGARVSVLEKDDPLTAAAKELGGQVAKMADGIEVDDDGRFDLAGVPSGPLTLMVTLRGHQTVLRDVRPSMSEVRVDLEPAAVFRGRVMDARSGEPVTSFHVLLRGHGMTMSNQLRPDDGRFRVDGLGQVEYRLEVKATGYRKAVLTDALPSFDDIEREILLVPMN